MTDLNFSASELIQPSVLGHHLAANFRLDCLQHDSRKVNQGDGFICLIGDNFDGHTFIDEVLAKGVSFLVFSDRSWEAKIRNQNMNYVLVEDTTRYLGELAGFRRQKFNPIIIAITGSNGKTSTKEILFHLLKASMQEGSVIATAGNLNNHWGLPFTLLRLQPETKCAVVEIGTNHPGEIALLTRIAQPNFSCISSVAAGHIGNFRNVEEIAEEKSDIMRNNLPPAIFVAGCSLETNPIIIKKWRSIQTNSSLNSQNFIRAMDIYTQLVIRKESLQSYHLFFKEILFDFPLKGNHQLQNLSLALTIFFQLLGDFPQMFRETDGFLNLKNALISLSSLVAVKGRLQMVMQQPFFIWDDSYNANLASFKQAIDTFCHSYKIFRKENSSENRPQKWVVVGHMAELGDHTLTEHSQLLEYIKKNDFDGLCFLSNDNSCIRIFREKWFQTNQENLLIASMDDDSVENVCQQLTRKLKPGDWLLIKGSRSAKTERVLNYLKHVDTAII